MCSNLMTSRTPEHEEEVIGRAVERVVEKMSRYTRDRSPADGELAALDIFRLLRDELLKPSK